MRYSLDTNVCIEYMRGRNAEIVRRFNQVHVSQIVVCSVVRSELLYGAGKSQNPVAEKAKVEAFLSLFGTRPYDDAAADVFVEQRLRLEQAGMMIGSFDLMIASISLAEGLVQVTHNTHEFSRAQGLAIEDWEVP
jgi:tRNA(fMet)-specific endonuclease VapC